MDDVKLCPGCGAEYFSHINDCGGCGIPLVHPEEVEAARAARAGHASDTLVCILEGPKERLKEISYALKAKEIDARVLKTESGGSSCSSSAGFGLFVASGAANAAAEMTAQLVNDFKDDLVDVDACYSNGQCPACGADITRSRVECPDCGLNLGGDPGEGADDCGSGCGPGC